MYCFGNQFSKACEGVCTILTSVPLRGRPETLDKIELGMELRVEQNTHLFSNQKFMEPALLLQKVGLVCKQCSRATLLVVHPGCWTAFFALQEELAEGRVLSPKASLLQHLEDPLRLVAQIRVSVECAENHSLWSALVSPHIPTVPHPRPLSTRVQ